MYFNTSSPFYLCPPLRAFPFPPSRILVLLSCTPFHTSSLISILLSPISLLFSPYSSYSPHTRTCTYSVENLSGPTSPSGIKPEDLTDDIFSFIFLAKPLPEGVSTNIPTALLQSMQEVLTSTFYCDFILVVIVFVLFFYG